MASEWLGHPAAVGGRIEVVGAADAEAADALLDVGEVIQLGALVNIQVHVADGRVHEDDVAPGLRGMLEVGWAARHFCCLEKPLACWLLGWHAAQASF